MNKKNIAGSNYDHAKIEKKWQKEWVKQGIYDTTSPAKVSKSAKSAQKKPKAYILDMFPYPSGAGLHVGHPRGYIATDIYSRFKKMNGFDVLHPMGWDAFGLPAEEFAIKNKVHPSIAVKKNVARYKEQLSILGFNYDWSREVNTTDPEYYKWTQWAFLQMHKKGLTYESHEPINWCPSCKTGLANEDLEDGKCERCGSVVEKKPIRQWVIRITNYADRLLKDLDNPKLKWPESIKESQRNWIGRSEGVNLICKIKDINMPIEMYDSIPQTHFAQTFAVIAADHPLLPKIVAGIENEKEILDFATRLTKKRNGQGFDYKDEMEGMYTGRLISYPAGNREIPLWIASYAVADYGTGIVSCSAHDERDFAFAKKHNIPLKTVLYPKNDPELEQKIKNLEIFYREPDGILAEPSVFAGRRWDESRKDIIDYLVKNKWAKRIVNYKLRDWVFSRQRYWGEPIPLVHCAKCAIQDKTIAKKSKLSLNFYKEEIWQDLLSGNKTIETRALNPEEPKRYFGNLKSGDVIEVIHRHPKTKKELDKAYFEVTNTQTWSTLAELLADTGALQKISPKNWKKYNTLQSLTRSYDELATGYAEKINKNGLIGLTLKLITTPIALPEKELPLKLPNVKSYEPTGTGESPLAAITSWVNTKCPKCKGPAKRETNTMPQWAGSCWYYLRYIDPKNKTKLIDPKKEKAWQPVDMYVGGAEHATRHLIYARFWHKFLHDIGVVSTKEPFMQLKNQGLIAAEDGRKMSKRYGNVVNPDDIVKLYGADTLRVYEMFMGPFDQGIAWSTDNMIGSRRFLERVWKASSRVDIAKKKESPEILTALHKTIKKVTEDIEDFSLNTAISSMMICLNVFEKADSITSESYKSFLVLLAPFAPHITEEIWSKMQIMSPSKRQTSIYLEPWPSYKSAYLVEQTVNIVIQVNSKIRATIEVANKDGENQEYLKKIALEHEAIAPWVQGKEVKRVIIIPKKLINIVV